MYRGWLGVLGLDPRGSCQMMYLLLDLWMAAGDAAAVMKTKTRRTGGWRSHHDRDRVMTEFVMRIIRWAASCFRFSTRIIPSQYTNDLAWLVVTW